MKIENEKLNEQTTYKTDSLLFKDESGFSKLISNHIRRSIVKLKESPESVVTSKNQLTTNIINVFKNILFENSIRFCKVNSDFYVFNDSYWIEIRKTTLINLFGDLYNFVFNSVYNYPSILENMVDMFLNTIVFYPFETIPDSYINFKDGVCDIITKEKILDNHKYFFKSCINYNFTDVLNCEERPTKFDKFLYDCLNEKNKTKDYIKAKIDVVYSFLAYALLKGVKIEKSLVLYGSGSNGKSTLLNIIQNLFGKENVSNVNINSIDKNTKMELFDMSGRYINVCSEIKLSSKSDVDLFKTIISKEPIMARRIYSLYQNIEDYPCQIFASNEIPNFEKLDHAIKRRMIIIEFKNTFEQNPNFLNDFEYSDYVAIFKKAIEYIPYILNGQIKGYEKLIENSNTLLSFKNSVEHFYISVGHTFFNTVSSDWISTKYLYSDSNFNSYIAFCDQFKYKPLSFDDFVRSSSDYLKLPIKNIKSKNGVYSYFNYNRYVESINKIQHGFDVIEDLDD